MVFVSFCFDCILLVLYSVVFLHVGYYMNEVRTESLVDFGLYYTAKEYYDSAQVLKKNQPLGNPYYILLALSIECYLKSIKTEVIWDFTKGPKVNHTKGHYLDEIFSALKTNHPKETDFLESQYAAQFNRSLSHDIERNAKVFTARRYPYSFKGEIPTMPVSENIADVPLYANDIAVYVEELEDVARFLTRILAFEH